MNFQLDEDCMLSKEDKVYYLVQLTGSIEFTAKVLSMTKFNVNNIYTHELKKRKSFELANKINLGILNEYLDQKINIYRMLKLSSDYREKIYYDGKIKATQELLEELNGKLLL